RQYSFWLMAIYMTSGLGLLLTTSFLGLRRYLRQRRLQMPKAMTATWLGVGGTLAIILLAMSAFLPRPQSETPLFEWTALGGERTASRYSLLDSDSAKGEGRPGGEWENDPQADNTRSGSQGRGGQGRDGQGRGNNGQDAQAQGGQAQENQGRG